MTVASAVRSPPAQTASYIAAAVLPVLMVVWIAADWPTVDAGTDLLARAAPGWVLAGFAVAATTWVAGAVCQQGAVLRRLPTGRLVAVQFAGSAANHVLPAGLGVAAVNMRFLRRQGLSRASALNAVGLNTCAGISVHLVALAALVAAGLTAPRAMASRGAVVVIAAAVAGGIVLTLVSVPALRRRWAAAVRAQLHSAAAQLSVVGRRPVRAVQLWTGSAAIPVLHGITLACMVQSLGGHMGIGAIFGAYFIASTISAAVPSPGGFGSLDAALTVALHAGGLPTATAIAAVIGYRVVTVWIPLLPSACAIAILRYRTII